MDGEMTSCGWRRPCGRTLARNSRPNATPAPINLKGRKQRECAAGDTPGHGWTSYIRPNSTSRAYYSPALSGQTDAMNFILVNIDQNILKQLNMNALRNNPHCSGQTGSKWVKPVCWS